MSHRQALACLEAGIEVGKAEVATGADVVGVGDMGIGNTAAASAVVAAITGAPVAAATGRGTGLSDDGLRRKVAVIERALAQNPQPRTPRRAGQGGRIRDRLRGGVMLGVAGRSSSRWSSTASSGRRPSSPAACARPAGVSPGLSSVRRAGHREALEHLGLRPVLDLGMRLGEGTGAVLGIFLVEAAARIVREMASFAQAGVSAGDGRGSPGSVAGALHLPSIPDRVFRLPCAAAAPTLSRSPAHRARSR
jgi:nicotinate-nucleotide--dimethylbenzimidazole phosphoribosyltransferase